MKKIYLILSIFVLMAGFLAPKQAQASHAAGAEIIYVHISDSTYQFFFKFYRDCTGISEPNTVNLCFFNTCTNQTFNRTMNKWTGTLPPDNRANGSPVSAGCSQYSNKCDNPSSNVPGYREWWYSTIMTLPIKCNYWKFGASINARNPQTNINPGTLYVETTFNSNISWNNSSPFYSVKPIPYVCLNQQYTYNNGALDADNDSLFSVIVRPLAANTCSGTPTQAGLRTLTPPIAFPNNPLQTNNQFGLNGNNGQMTFTATLQGAATLTMRTNEYRNGSLIGSIMRDVQVQVLPCSTLPPKLDTVSINDSGTFLNNKVFGCVGQQLEFCFDVSSTDTSAILIAGDNLATAIPGATMTYTNQKEDSVRGCFSWTPTINDVGPHSFLVQVKDSTCKPPGILLQYAHVIDLQIWGPVKASADTNICRGEPAFLGVTGGDQYQWTVLSGTQNSLNNPNIPGPTATPTATTTYLVTSTANPYCPSFNKDTVVITVEEGPAIAGQADDTTCPGNEIGLDIGITKVPGEVYSVQWTPATGLSNDTVENPKVNIKGSRTYYVEVGSNTNRCKTFDTVMIEILNGFSIENPDTAICQGEEVRTRGTGDNRYNYTWTAPLNPGAAYSDPGAIVNRITPSDTGTFTFYLTGRYPGCPDSVASFEIEIQPVPTVQVNEDATLCFGDTMKLTAVVNPDTYNGYDFSWDPGAALDYPTRLQPIFTAVTEGQHKLVFTAVSSAGCTDSDDVELNVYPAEFLTLPGDTAICPGDSITLDLEVAADPKFVWTPDFNISSVSAQKPTVWPVTDQLFTVYGIDTFGCLDTNEIYVTVRPRAIIDLPDTVTIYPGEAHRMDPGGNCLYYSWFPSIGLSRSDVSNPMAQPQVNTRYVIHGRTDAGCVVTDSVDVIVKNDSYIEMPNAFNPARGRNSLKILRRGDVELKNYTIYNRWGTKVFQTTDINEGWDGTLDGEKQPMGVYIYIVEAVTPSGRTVNKQGNITLIR